jgi:multidrug efflux system outer membrane protein
MFNTRLVLALTAAALLAGCSLAPTFQKPVTETPPAFKEDASNADKAASKSWRKAEPLEGVDRGQWWILFSDPKLNTLESEAAAGNQSLKAAAARVLQARDAVRANAADFLPNLSLGANGARSAPGLLTPTPYTLYNTQATASYDPDLFSRVRDADRATAFDAEGTQATYRSVLLALQADVAQDYFLIRALDDERLLLRQTVDIREKEAKIMQDRFKHGDVGAQDDANARSDLASARADLSGLDRQRATFEHALAILLGKAPAGFSLPDSPLAGSPPSVPGGVPSVVLERRPDIASAISSMQAANQRIGSAKAAFFPDLFLTASLGSESSTLGNLFHWSSRAWALGQVGALALTLPVFDNGRHTAELDSARAAYDEAVANYRQQVLVAFKDVEDGLSDQHYLYHQWDQAREAATQSSRATYLVQKRYDLGDVDYFEVVTTQRTSLAAERAAVQLNGQRFVATVNLIRALGGGWEVPHDTAQPLVKP